MSVVCALVGNPFVLIINYNVRKNTQAPVIEIFLKGTLRYRKRNDECTLGVSVKDS